MNKQIYKYAKLQKIKGFTIVELLIYMSLMGIFLIVLLDIFTTTINSKLSGESTSVLNQDSRYILSKLSYDINNADSVVSPALGVTSSSLQTVQDGITYTYASSSGNFVKTASGVTMSLNGTDTYLDDLTFKNIGNVGGKSTIQINYTLHSKITVFNGTSTQTTNTTVGLR